MASSSHNMIENKIGGDCKKYVKKKFSIYNLKLNTCHVNCHK